jgi:SAM-dependent methyltransferase
MHRLPRRPIRFGSFRRTAPISSRFGFDRGQPIDRYYIEKFLSAHAYAIKGCILEIGDDTYSRQFGATRITHQEVLHVVPGHPGATMIADLANAPEIPSSYFDCVILTQTMHYIFDLPAAVATLFRILKPGGTLLVTVPGISQICRDQSDQESDCWRFTASSSARLFSERFGRKNVTVRTYGNVLASIAFLEGLASSDLTRDELDYRDPNYQLTIAVAARKEVD